VTHRQLGSIKRGFVEIRNRHSKKEACPIHKKGQKLKKAREAGSSSKTLNRRNQVEEVGEIPPGKEKEARKPVHLIKKKAVVPRKKRVAADAGKWRGERLRMKRQEGSLFRSL